MSGEYDREWTVSTDDPDRETRLRFGFSTENGDPTRFLVQLEYRFDDGWQPIARFDHERDGPAYRDVETSGLHLDVYAPDGTQKRKVTGFPPIDEKAAVPAAEQYLHRHYQRLIEEYERCL